MLYWQYQPSCAIVNGLYSKLIRFGVKAGSRALLVVRPSMFLDSTGRDALISLSPFLSQQDTRSEWPGTTLLKGTADVRVYDLNSEAADVMLSLTRGVFDWRQPHRPEDLCLLRPDGTPWFISISHENECYFVITREEAQRLLDEISGLSLKEEE